MTEREQLVSESIVERLGHDVATIYATGKVDNIGKTCSTMKDAIAEIKRLEAENRALWHDKGLLISDVTRYREALEKIVAEDPNEEATGYDDYDRGFIDGVGLVKLLARKALKEGSDND